MYLSCNKRERPNWKPGLVEFISVSYLGQTQHFRGRYLEQRRVIDRSDINVKGEPEASLQVSRECIIRPGYQRQFQNHAVLCGFATVVRVLYLSRKVNYHNRGITLFAMQQLTWNSRNWRNLENLLAIDIALERTRRLKPTRYRTIALRARFPCEFACLE